MRRSPTRCGALLSRPLRESADSYENFHFSLRYESSKLALQAGYGGYGIGILSRRLYPQIPRRNQIDLQIQTGKAFSFE